MKRLGASPPEPWHVLLAPLPAGVVPRRSAVAPPEVVTMPEGAAIAGWENLLVDLSAGPAGSRHAMVVLDETGRPIAASDHVMYRSEGRAEEGAAGERIPVEYRHESVGGRLEADGTFRGTRWRNVNIEEADGTMRSVEMVSSEPTAEDLAALQALVAEIMSRSSGVGLNP